jgi:hypothetical protein
MRGKGTRRNGHPEVRKNGRSALAKLALKFRNLHVTVSMMLIGESEKKAVLASLGAPS